MSQKITLTISMDEKGNIGLEGPLDRKILCYGLLASAQDMIREYNAVKEQPAIERPSLADVHAITSGHNGHQRG